MSKSKYKNNLLNRAFRMLLKDYGITRYRITKELGYSTATLTKWRNGETRINVEQLEEIADLVNQTTDITIKFKPKTQNENENTLEKTH